MAVVRRALNRGGWPAACAWGVATVVVLRVVLGLLMGVAWRVASPYMDADRAIQLDGGLSAYATVPGQLLLGVWPRYDAINHLTLARLDYLSVPEGHTVYYPLFIVLTRLCAAVAGGDYLAGGLIVSTLAACAAFACLHRLADHHYGPQAARWAVVALACYPTAVFLIAPYTESLFLALTLGAFSAAYARRWWLAGLLGCLASLTRGPGMLTAAALAWMAWNQWKGELRGLLGWSGVSVCAGLVLPVLGGLGFMAWRSWHGLAPISDVLARRSGLVLTNPISGLWAAIVQWARVRDLHTSLDLGSAVVFIALAVSMAVRPRWRRPEWLIYVGAHLILLLSKETFAASSLQSLSRYVLSLFPAFIVAGDWLEGRGPRARLAYLAVSGAVLTMLSVLYALWVFIG
ncbi:MAG: hypothetical protein ISS56_04265 [Anaerolineae bacterium]|nr:hypothetical protein [Anaerolineae bacterium]